MAFASLAPSPLPDLKVGFPQLLSGPQPLGCSLGHHQGVNGQMS